MQTNVQAIDVAADRRFLFGFELSATALALLMGLCTFFLLSIQRAEGWTPPDQLPIGKMQVLEKLADATTFRVECTAPGMKSFQQEVVIPADFQSVADIRKAISSVKVTISPEDPLATITLHAEIKDFVGDVMFEAEQGFELEKVYTKSGEVDYRLPDWVGDLYFWFVGTPIYFEGATSASFVYSNGHEVDLNIDGSYFYVGYFGAGYLKITTPNGVYVYDWNTGIRVSGEIASTNLDVSFEDVRTVSGGNVYRTLYPEWNYVPWLEVKVPANGVVTLDVLSTNGSQPSGVWIRSLEQLRNGTEPPPQQYNSGMTLNLKPGSTVYIWFDFPDWVWGSGDSGGKG